ncbi:hypothetical protein V8G54_018749 [Vigna mungo]|uniref:Uncharacterized protein n=1 Tax=Vigna mungo TaxID=3915 RepID=A0AAQ3RU98_VIGMU
MEELEEEAWLFSTLSSTRSPKDEAGAPTDPTRISDKAIVFPKSLILGSFASDIYGNKIKSFIFVFAKEMKARMMRQWRFRVRRFSKLGLCGFSEYRPFFFFFSCIIFLLF